MATSLVSVMAGVAFMLIHSGLLAESDVRNSTAAVTASARLARSIRGEVARADSVAHVSPDSLAVVRPDGAQVAYATRTVGVDVEVRRWLDTGSGWEMQPMRVFAVLSGDELEGLFEMAYHTKHVGTIFDRVFKHS